MGQAKPEQDKSGTNPVNEGLPRRPKPRGANLDCRPMTQVIQGLGEQPASIVPAEQGSALEGRPERGDVPVPFGKCAGNRSDPVQIDG